MANLETIVDELSSLTVLEAAELAKLLEEKWGVSAAAAVAVAAAASARVCRFNPSRNMPAMSSRLMRMVKSQFTGSWIVPDTTTSSPSRAM